MPKRRVKMEFTGVDRLSALPDELLLHIMSFLKAKEAAKTCILSKRFKNLWAYIPCLNFDCVEFLREIDFISFVNSFISRRKASQIDAFRLTWYYYGECNAPTQKWILDALNSQPRQLSINATTPPELPDSLFTCASIETMKLQFSCSYSMLKYKSIELVSLKQLNLTFLTLYDNSVEKLISGCPSLEELVIKECTLSDFGFTITSHILRKLIINECDFSKCVVVQLFTPNLLSLHVTGTKIAKILLRNMKSLVQARIQLDGFINSYMENGYELLMGLSNATRLELIEEKVGFGVLDLLEKGLPICPDFENLKSLHLGKWCMITKFNLIVGFVHASPNLEMLTLHHKEKHKNGAELAFRIQCKHPKRVLIKFSDHDVRVKELIDTLMASLGSLKKN